MSNLVTSSIFNINFQSTPEVVVPGRLELPTSTLSVWRSNQLSYRTVFGLSSLESHLPIIFIKQIRVQEAWVQANQLLKYCFILD